MKKVILTLFTVSLLLSCNNTNEDNKPSTYELFKKSTKFLESKVNDDPEKGAVTFIEIDTVNAISSKEIETIKKIPLMNELKHHMKYYEKFKDIDDQFDSEEGSQTSHHRENIIELRDSLQSWNSRIAQLDSTDTIGYEVKILAEAVDAESGAKMKDITLPVYFDDEYDVSLRWNELMYGNNK